MQQHSFSDFSYAINKTSAKKGYKEILVCYIYNGVEVLRKLYIREKEGTSYIFEAKKIIDQEMKSGVLASYSYKFVKRKESKNGGKASWKWIAITAGIAAVAIAGMSVGMYFVGKNSIGGGRSTYDVKFIYDSCSPDGAAKVKRKAEYTCSFAAAQNKQVVSIQSIYMGSKLLDSSCYTFTTEGNKLTLNINEGVITDDLYISAKGHGQHEASAGMKYEITENGAIATSVDYEGKLSDIGTIIIPNQVDGVDVVEIAEGALTGCGYLQNLSVPFIGRYKNAESTNATVEEQMVGSIFGDKDYTGGIPVWQDYVDTSGAHKMKKWIIPNDLSDITITGDSKIGMAAFSECSRINDVTISGNVGEIGDYAFYGCKALESVVFPDGSVQKIGVSTFGSCNTLTAIGPVASDEETVLLNLKGVESVGANAFSDCAGAQETFIPETVTSIGANAFASVGGIVMVEALEKPSGWDPTWIGDTTAVIYGSNGEVTPITDGAYKFIVTKEADGTEYAFLTEYIGEQYAENVVIPNTVSDGSNTYYVRQLGMGLFYQYTPFETVTFKCTKLLAIGNYCFMGCTNLQTINFDNSETNEDFQLEKVGMGAFLNCSSLDFEETVSETIGNLDVTTKGLPASVKEVGASAFKGCISLEEVALPRTKTLGASVFEGCSNLKKVKFNSDIGSVGEKAYLDCSKLTNLYYYYNASEAPSWEELGKNFTQIPDECFKNTAIVGTQNIPYYVTRIGESAFENCAITELRFELGVVEGVSKDKCKLMSIGKNAFANCSKLLSVNSSGGTGTADDPKYGGLQNAFNLQSIGEGAFRNCNKLGTDGTHLNVQIGNSTDGSALTDISDGAFDGCVNITGFISPTNTLKSIGAKAFYSCNLMNQFLNGSGWLSPTLGKIGDLAFYNCTSIPHLRIRFVNGTSPSTFEMGADVFKGWVTQTGSAGVPILDPYETDVSNYVEIEVGWMRSYTRFADTNETAWNWTLTDDTSSQTWLGDGYTERYYTSQSGSSDLYLHIVSGS